MIDAITRGEFSEKVFPTREELCERYHVAPMTARRALAKLEREGYLSCARGRRARVSRDLAELVLKTTRRGMTIGLVCPEVPEETFWLPELLTRLKTLVHHSGNAAVEIKLTENPDARANICDGYIILGMRETSPALYLRFAGPGMPFCGCGFSAAEGGGDVCLSVHSYMTEAFLFLVRRKVRHLSIYSRMNRLPLLHARENAVFETLSRECGFPLTAERRELPDFTDTALYHEARAEILRCGASREKPCAVLFASPLYAKMFWKMAMASGLAAEGAIFPIGYHPGLKLEDALEYPVIDFDLDGFTRAGLYLLFNRIERRDRGEFLLHVPRFILPKGSSVLESCPES